MLVKPTKKRIKKPTKQRHQKQYYCIIKNYLSSMVSSLPELPPPLSFLCIVIVLIIYVICCYLLIDFISYDDQEDDYLGTSGQESRVPGGTIRLSIQELEEMSRVYSKTGSSCSICVVCLEKLKNAEVCRVLPNCHHEFHALCVDPWLLEKLTCPTCRTPFRFR